MHEIIAARVSWKVCLIAYPSGELISPLIFISNITGTALRSDWAAWQPLSACWSKARTFSSGEGLSTESL